MFTKICKFIYLLVVVSAGIFALALGAANSSEVVINLWFVKLNTTLAAVMSCAAVAGAVFISLCWLYICVKLRLSLSQLKRRLKQYEDQDVRQDVRVEATTAVDHASATSNQK